MGLRDQTQFVFENSDTKYLVMSRFNDEQRLLEVVDLRKVVLGGSKYIRRQFEDFEVTPITLRVDLLGNVMTANKRLGTYWWMFKENPVLHLNDLGIKQTDVGQFLFEVENEMYVNGSLKITYMDVPVFNVNASLSDEDSIRVYLTFVDEIEAIGNYVTGTFRSMLDQLDDGIVAVDNLGRVIYTNRRFLKMMNVSHAVGFYLKELVVLYDNKNRVVNLEFPLEANIYSYLWLGKKRRSVIELVINEMRESDGFIIGYLLNFRDMSVRENRELEALEFAYKDAQTGVYNRHYLNELILDLESKQTSNLGVVMIDCNALKVVNDAFGHDLGDAVIAKTADILWKSKGNLDSVIRLGGDEFLVVKRNITEEDLEAYMDSILEKVSGTKVGYIPLSASIGASYHDNGILSFGELLNEAEVAMYHHKTMESKVARDHVMESILQVLVDRNPWEKEHSEFVSEINRKISEKLKMGTETVQMISDTGKYHSIGKVVLDEVVHLDGGVSLKYKDKFLKHNEIAFRILSAMPEYSYLATGILHYKENFDGTGIPEGLKGKDIPLASRILRVSSAYHKLINPMEGRGKKHSVFEALEYLEIHSDSKYDGEIVQVLKEIVLD